MIEAAPGKVRDYAGQRYTCVAIEPYTRRRDGASSYLAVWHSKCAQCGALFSYRSPRRVVRFQPNRRCGRHRRPGTHVQLDLSR
jgi:hypothetical protein